MCWVVVVLALGLLYGSGLRGFCHGGNVLWSGVLRECFFSMCVCRVVMILVGYVVIYFVIGSRIASRLG